MRFLWLSIFLLLSGGAFAANPNLPKLWRGEILEPDDSLIYLYPTLIDGKVQSRNGEISFLLRGKKQGLIYSFQVKTQDKRSLPAAYWKIKRDDYELLELNFVDEFGKARKWKGPYSKPFTLLGGAVHSLGSWFAVLIEDQPRVLIKPFVARLALKDFKGSVRQHIDGLSGQVLQTYRPEAAASNQIRQVVRVTRGISMVYKLDLLQMNRLAPPMAAVLQANDADLRSCYTDLLEKDERAAGSVAVAFVYSGQIQGIKSLKLQQSGLPDAAFQQCLSLKLQGLDFPLRESLAGRIVFQFKTVPQGG